MERAKIKVPLLLIAAGSTAYWLQPVGPVWLVAGCGLWLLVALAAFRWEKAEDWTYRLSSFVGVALCTIEGIAGLLALLPRPGLLLMAVLHGAAFVLAVVGRYQKVSGKRERRL